MKLIKKIRNINKKQGNFQKFTEEKEKENTSKPKDQYNVLRSRSSSISSNYNKTIYRTMSNENNNNKKVILKMNEIIKDYPEKYYKNYLKSDLFKLIKNILILFIHPIIIFLYIDSINACSKKISLNECIEILNINYYYKVTIECFICGILISYYLVLIILRVIYLWHFLIIIIELIFFISINHENNLYKNGLFSFKLLLEFMLISFAFFLFFSLFIRNLRKLQFFYATFFFFAQCLFAQLIYLYIF